MLRQLCEKHGLIFYSSIPPAGKYADESSMAALSELLLAAKGQSSQAICQGCRRNLLYRSGMHQDEFGSWNKCAAKAIREADWGDLFEEKA